MYVLPSRGVLLGSVKTSEAFLCLQPHCPGCTSRSAKRLDWISDSIPSWNDRDTVPVAAHARFVQLEAFAGASTVRPGPSTQSEFTNIKEKVTSRCRFTNVKKSVYLNMSVSNGLKLLTSIYLSWELIDKLVDSALEQRLQPLRFGLLWVTFLHWANRCAMPHSICAQAQTMVSTSQGSIEKTSKFSFGKKTTLLSLVIHWFSSQGLVEIKITSTNATWKFGTLSKRLKRRPPAKH